MPTVHSTRATRWLAVATLVALAARGPLIALLVLGLIVVIGQIEGHLLHPMVMSRAVNLHPLAVALAVASGTVLAGVIGAVVAVPLVAVTWTVWSAFRAVPRSEGDRAGPAMDDPGPEPRLGPWRVSMRSSGAEGTE